MDPRLSTNEGIRGQVAAITGGAGSIGRATAAAFVQEGATVWLLDLPEAQETAEMDSIGANIAFLPTDVGSATNVQNSLAQIKEKSGRIDIAVGGAGVAAGTPLSEITTENFDEIIAVNLRGCFNLIQAVAPAMESNGYGKIVLLGSVAGHQGGVKSGPHYVAAKAGVHGLTRCASKNLGPSNIYVNAVAPGPVLTAMWAGLGGGTEEDQLHEYAIKRLGRPEDVAQAILFLSSPASNWITGITLDVNGGFYFS